MPQLTTSDDIVLLVTACVALAMLVAGFVERRRVRQRLASIPLRISVNGSRGKSTVTRLLTGALAADGYRPLGKTTGTEAQLILGWSGEEEPVHRRPEGPNIGEQRQLVRRAVHEGADIVVAECMAIEPEFQSAFHRDLLGVNLLVVTNALDDHLEQMGPTSHDVAEVFADAVPEGGAVAVLPDQHLSVFRDMASRRGASLLLGRPEDVDPGLLTRFGHLVLPEHIALVLAVTRSLGIDDDTAIAGMLEAPADPYATRVIPVGDPGDPAWFVNAFAANDPESTLAIWHLVHDRSLPDAGLTVVMHCRSDRVDRTRQFADDLLPELPIDTLVVTGDAARPVLRAVHAGAVPARSLHDLTGADTDAVMDVLDPLLSGRVVLGVGNLHDGAAELVGALEHRTVQPHDHDRSAAYHDRGAA